MGIRGNIFITDRTKKITMEEYEIVEKIIALAKEQPNDQTFGNKVRDFINNLSTHPDSVPFYPTLEQSDKRLLKLINNYYGRNNK
tara:strand:+ start:304 stop:558 length:255 start_codon:yes stop_codon:yes gene_type:complete